jgi:hypothetical protein
MEIKLEFDNKIKEKYGEELHSVFSRYFSQSMAEIWDSEGGNAIEINKIESLLKEKSQKLSNLEKEFEIKLEALPKISKIDLEILDKKQDSKEILGLEEIASKAVCTELALEEDIDQQKENQNQVENMHITEEEVLDFSSWKFKLNLMPNKSAVETELFSSPTEHVKRIRRLG